MLLHVYEELHSPDKHKTNKNTLTVDAECDRPAIRSSETTGYLDELSDVRGWAEQQQHIWTPATGFGLPSWAKHCLAGENK